MEAINFEAANTLVAEHQDEYLTLPAYKDEDGYMVTCWKGTWWDRWKFLFTSRLWLHIRTFNKPVQPLYMSVDAPILTPFAQSQHDRDDD